MAPLPRTDVTGTLLLHRFAVKPRHLDDWLALWPEEAALRTEAGYTLHRLFVETDAEPKVSLLCSHPHPSEATVQLLRSLHGTGLADRLAPHVFRNAVTRRVRPEFMTHATPESIEGRIAIMRRYSIVGSWAEFLEVWERVLEVRERHGFRGLFAVSDEEKDLFTWAFDFAGEWADFPAAQRDYYHDPDRVALRGVFDFMADYSIHPARQVLL